VLVEGKVNTPQKHHQACRDMEIAGIWGGGGDIGGSQGRANQLIFFRWKKAKNRVFNRFYPKMCLIKGF